MVCNGNRMIFDPEFIVLLGKEKRNHFRIFGGMRISDISTHLNTHPISAASYTCLILHILYSTVCCYLMKCACAQTHTTMCSSVFVRVTRFFGHPDVDVYFLCTECFVENCLLFMRDVLSFQRERERERTKRERERVNKKIDSKKIVQTQNQKYPTNRSRCNTLI